MLVKRGPGVSELTVQDSNSYMLSKQLYMQTAVCVVVELAPANLCTGYFCDNVNIIYFLLLVCDIILLHVCITLCAFLTTGIILRIIE